MIKRLILQEDKILNVYVPNTEAAKYSWKKTDRTTKKKN
jgi:hypothetical protein